jgi:hypothetical protein
MHRSRGMERRYATVPVGGEKDEEGEMYTGWAGAGVGAKESLRGGRLEAAGGGAFDVGVFSSANGGGFSFRSHERATLCRGAARGCEMKWSRGRACERQRKKESGGKVRGIGVGTQGLED